MHGNPPPVFFGEITRQLEIFSRAFCVSWLISVFLKFKTKMFTEKMFFILAGCWQKQCHQNA